MLDVFTKHSKGEAENFSNFRAETSGFRAVMQTLNSRAELTEQIAVFIDSKSVLQVISRFKHD